MIDLQDFKLGLKVIEDSTKAPLGSARECVNMLISDRGGISKRPGTQLLGTYNSTASGTKGLYTYTKSGEVVQIPLKAYGTVTEYYHPDLLDWKRLEGSFTSGEEWGFKEHLVNTENEDYLYFCNRTEPYRRWSGAYTQLNGALVGAESTITVDGVLKDDVYYSGTASAVTTTTIDVSTTPWTNDQWNTFYVKITSGAKSGYISLINDTDSNTITFATIADLSGTPTFEIRLAKFPTTGTLVINTDTIAYTAMPTSTTFTVGSAPVAADNSPVTIYPTQYGAAPKGNRLENYLTRMIVGNVRSALSRDASGNLQGSQSSGSYYVSKLKNASDFTFAATRVAGEGDIVSAVFGGGNITDVVTMEKSFIVFKKNYAELVQYTQDANDIAQREPLMTGYGSINKVLKAKDDIYFVTERNEITSVGRVANKDTQPQAVNIGYPIKRLIDKYDFSNTAGIEFKDRLLFNAKESSTDAANNRIIVYNRNTNSFEGIWQIGAFGFTIYGGNLYYGDSHSPNIYKMFEGTTDQQGTDTFGISSVWKSNWLNLAPSKQDLQSISSLGVEGYIRTGTTLTFRIYKDFENDATLSFDFNGTEEDFISSENFGNFLGADPLGISQEGTIGAPDEIGMRHFQFVVYFPYIYSNFYSISLENTGKNQGFDITRMSLGITIDALRETRIKTI